MIDKEKIDEILAGMDSQGELYYLENYAKGDFKGTKLEEPLGTFLEALREFRQWMVCEGVDIDSY